MFFKKKNVIQEQSKIQAAADRLFSQKKYQKALNEYLKLTKVIPDDLVLLNKIGDVYSKIKDFQNAFKYFERVASHHASTGFLPKAIAVYKKILKLDPEHTEARESLVQLYLQKDLTSEAKAELKKIAAFYIDNNLTSRALDTLKKLVDLEPSNIQYHNQLAELLIKEGRSKEACQQFFEMARSFKEKNMTQQAKMVVQKALNLDPNNPDILIISAKLFIQEGQFDKGASKLQQVLSKNPNHLEALHVMGDAFFQRGDYEHAHQCYYNVLQKDATQTQPLEKLVTTLLQEKQLARATQYLEPLASLLVREKKQDQAIALVRNVLEIDEFFEPAVDLLIRIYMTAKMTSNAILILEKIANHYLNQNHPDKAVPFIEQIVEIDPDNLEWRSQLDSAQRPLSGMGSLRNTEQEDPRLPESDELELPGDHSLRLNEQMPPSQTDDSASIDAISAFISGGLEASEIEDTSTSLKNQLTEVEIFIRHGILDRAKIHLNKILNKFPDHFEANMQLRHIYLEEDNMDQAASCNLVIARAFIEKRELDKALEHLQEAEPFQPGAVRKLRGIVEKLENEDISFQFDQVSSAAYDPDLSSGDLSPEMASKLVSNREDLIIEPPDEEEIVSIHKESSGFDDFDAPQNVKSASDDSIWALDIPAQTSPKTSSQDSTGDDSKIVFDFMKDEPESPEEKKPTEQIAIPDDEFFQDESVTEKGLSLSGSFEEEIDLDLLQDEPAESQLPDAGEEIQIPSVDDDFEFQDEKPEPPDSSREEPEPALDMESDESDDLLDLINLDEDDEPDDVDASEVSSAESTSEAILNELEEIDFFISMEAFQEAHNLVLEAIEKHGPLPDLLRKQQEIPELKQTPLPPDMKQDDQGAMPDLFDLASVLSDEFFDEEKEVTDNSAPEEFQSVEELFKEFKKGVAEQIADTDFQTHYDLGIGYKEMGLLKEGISEFRIAMGDPNRFLECVTMISICQKELGQTDEAISTIKEAIVNPTLDQDSQNILRYELAITYEGNGDLEQAISIFKEIESLKPDFRDVKSRIEMLI